jgi:hypothetical protein
MAITGADLKFLAAARMTDNYTTSTSLGGGGPAGTAIVQDNVENNIFPDVMPSERAAGVTQYRKVFPSVLSDDNAALSNAKVGLVARPASSGVQMVCLGFGSSKLLAFDAQAAARLSDLTQEFSATLLSVTRDGVDLTRFTPIGGTVPAVILNVGDRVWFNEAGSPAATPELVTIASITGNQTTDPAWFFNTVSPVSATLNVNPFLRRTQRNAAGAQVSALSLSTVASSGAVITVDRLLARIEQAGSGFLPLFDGQAALYLVGDRVLVQHATVDATREFATIARVNWITNELTFTAALSTTYPIGSKVTRCTDLGALRAAVSLTPFSQQAWARIFADTASGAAITARYSGSLPLLNEGAVTDRWACVFTSATQFNLISERLGQIAAGNIGSDFSPLNPLTSQPYFTLLAAGWGSGWLAGNVLRFNTQAAAAELWLARCVEPGAALADDQGTLLFLGDVDA